MLARVAVVPARAAVDLARAAAARSAAVIASSVVAVVLAGSVASAAVVLASAAVVLAVASALGRHCGSGLANASNAEEVPCGSVANIAGSRVASGRRRQHVAKSFVVAESLIAHAATAGDGPFASIEDSTNGSGAGRSRREVDGTCGSAFFSDHRRASAG